MSPLNNTNKIIKLGKGSNSSWIKIISGITINFVYSNSAQYFVDICDQRYNNWVCKDFNNIKDAKKYISNVLRDIFMNSYSTELNRI